MDVTASSAGPSGAANRYPSPTTRALCARFETVALRLVGVRPGLQDEPAASGALKRRCVTNRDRTERVRGSRTAGSRTEVVERIDGDAVECADPQAGKRDPQKSWIRPRQREVVERLHRKLRVLEAGGDRRLPLEHSADVREPTAEPRGRVTQPGDLSRKWSARTTRHDEHGEYACRAGQPGVPHRLESKKNGGEPAS